MAEETRYEGKERESYVRSMYKKGVLALTLGLAGLSALVSGCASPIVKADGMYLDQNGRRVYCYGAGDKSSPNYNLASYGNGTSGIIKGITKDGRLIVEKRKVDSNINNMPLAENHSTESSPWGLSLTPGEKAIYEILEFVDRIRGER